MQLPWNDIENVLLDMDGSLLDLHFDNHFWREHVTLRYAERHGLEIDTAKNTLVPIFRSMEGRRMHHKLGNPTVMIVVDRIDLDTQITATFNAADIPNMIGAATRQELQGLLAADTRKIIITTIHKFGEAGGRLNERSNIIVMVDEAHRTQEGDLGRKMREALPNAFLFGLTGTPINKRDRNTFWAFGADEDEQGYMSRYSFQDSVRDRATLPLHASKRPRSG